MPPEALEAALTGLAHDDDRLLAGKAGDFEDGAVVRLPGGQGLVQTLDFLTPMVDDPRGFGRIAAANALSDVYAMGGTPLSAMNIVCFPCDDAPAELLAEIMAGGREAVLEAGAVPAGGHSVRGDALLYGLSVSGLVDPGKMATNAGARPGDVLVLTKPLGTGVLVNGLLARWEGHEEIERGLIAHCGRLNKGPGSLIAELGIRAATDITGFGLGGHLLEVARASGVSMEVCLAELPLMDRALELASMGLLPGGSIANREHYLPRCEVPDGHDPLLLSLAFDAQTSGGLVLAVPPEALTRAEARLAELGEPAAIIGQVAEPREDGKRVVFV